jgi:hypothetical protein
MRWTGIWHKWGKRKRKCRCVNNTKINLGERDWRILDWIFLAQVMDKRRALVIAIITLRVLLFSENLLCGFTTGGLSNSAHLPRVS